MHVIEGPIKHQPVIGRCARLALHGIDPVMREDGMVDASPFMWDASMILTMRKAGWIAFKVCPIVAWEEEGSERKQREVKKEVKENPGRK
ncbi:hypothetical protein Q3G72_018290 [Acer saccharum]|nr:hypothetical protein Q3G72_018290 [Acer saccharum]